MHLTEEKSQEGNTRLRQYAYAHFPQLFVGNGTGFFREFAATSCLILRTAPPAWGVGMANYDTMGTMDVPQSLRRTLEAYCTRDPQPHHWIRSNLEGSRHRQPKRHRDAIVHS